MPHSRLIVGCGGPSGGLRALRVDLATGSLAVDATVNVALEDATFFAPLAMRPGWVAAVQESPARLAVVDVSANTVIATCEIPHAGPCHVCAVTGGPAMGQDVLVSCYNGGALVRVRIDVDGRPTVVAAALSPLLSENGSDSDHLQARNHAPGPNATRQDAAHVHASYILPAALLSDPAPAQRALVCDLGLDVATIVELGNAVDGCARLTAIRDLALPAGSGPRHAAIVDEFAYIVGELDASVSVVHIPSGERRQHISTRAEDHPHGSQVRQASDAVGPGVFDASEITVVPGGDVVLVANRTRAAGDHGDGPKGSGGAEIACFARCAATGRLDARAAPVRLGPSVDHPRHMVVVGGAGDGGAPPWWLVVADRNTGLIASHRLIREGETAPTITAEPSSSTVATAEGGFPEPCCLVLI
jgi:6-phosphogluconolactonase (cycloisomerase 2 family)